MKPTLPKTLSLKQRAMNVTKGSFSCVLIILFSIICTNSYAQKSLDQQELQQKLTDVNENIEKIDEAIAKINARIAGVPPENVSPAVQTRLNDLQVKKDQYIREKISIEAALNTSENSNDSFRVDDSSNSAFLSLPNQGLGALWYKADPIVVLEN